MQDTPFGGDKLDDDRGKKLNNFILTHDRIRLNEQQYTQHIGVLHPANYGKYTYTA